MYKYIDGNKKTYIDNETSTLTYIDNFWTSTYVYGDSKMLSAYFILILTPWINNANTHCQHKPMLILK